VRDVVLHLERRFRQARLYFGHGTDNARDEAAWLVASALAIPFAELDDHAERVLTVDEAKRVQAIEEQRITTRKPLAYLLHEAWFAGHRFYVDERVIVPRSLIGEFIHERFRPWVDPARISSVLDLCTGSGCIAIATALEFPQVHVDAVDLSPEALAVARRNVEAFGLDARISLLQSDLFTALRDRRYDLILTNPPYVDAADMASLPVEYRHEPALALASGQHGLDAIIRILADAPQHLNPGGVLIAEVGNSHVALRKQFPKVPFAWLESPSGDDSVFLIDREKLSRHTAKFRASWR